MSFTKKVNDGRSLKRDAISKEVNKLKVKTLQEGATREICPDTGEEIEAKPVQVNNLTRVMRFLGNYKGKNEFLLSIKKRLRYYGAGSLTPNQIQGVINVMEYGKKLKKYQTRKIRGDKSYDKNRRSTKGSKEQCIQDSNH